MKKEKSKTLTTYKRLKWGDRALKAGVFLTPVATAGVVAGVNWSDWFNKSSINLPVGLVSLIATVVVSFIGIINSDTVIKKKNVSLYFLALVLGLVGITNLFLASLFDAVGKLFLYISASIVASAIEYTVDEKVIQPKRQFYKELVDTNCLDKKSQKRAEKIRLAEEEARNLAKDESKGLI